MKKILLFSKFGEENETSYYRYFQYIPELRSKGFYFESFPLFSQKADMLFAHNGKISSFEYILAYIKRFYYLTKVKSFHGAILDLELFPYFPFGLENLFFEIEFPIILDIYNGFFYKYSYGGNFLIKKILANKISYWIARSEAVLVSNLELENLVKTWNSNVFFFPFAFQKEYIPLKKENSESHEIILGWTGSTFTSRYLSLIFEPVRELKRFFPLKFFLLGASSQLSYPIKTEIVELNKEIEMSLLSKVDIAVNPLPLTLREKVNPCLEVLKCMYAKLPVVCTWNDSTKLYIENSETGFLAKTQDDWYLYLRMLVEDEVLRKEIGARAKQKVEVSFSPKQNLEIFLKVLGKFF